ncbi:hypothetical protein V495_06309 [Pseudogymnoascus sp. VKM F-4514 (FW-929)]|nr:hypothetical protein V495_06309 [Pseudogymnoascus sp. VKM F-4514 (FW-929)]KFY56314.1 hypothetical protein V497_06385 [Pseudogymnoascus sp. VKM F-4516 (FW-969)]
MATPVSITACVLHGPKDIRIETLPSAAALAPNEVTVRVTSTGLCGSDLHYYNHYRNGDIIVREPLVLGHESCGYVTAVGPDTTSLQVGDFVALEVGLPCGTCDLCSEGRYNICPDLRFRSSAKSWPHFQGTLQSEINHPADKCYKLPPTLDPRLGALIEPLCVAMHTHRRAALPPNSTVLIIGAGAVGLLCAAVAKANGHRVVISDLQPLRIEFATTHNFADAGFVVPLSARGDTAANLATAATVAGQLRDKAKELGGVVDAVMECTGAEASLQTAILAARPGGKVMLVGMGTPVQTLPVSAAALREVDLMGVFRYTGFGGVKEAFAMAGQAVDKEGGLVIKVVVEFPKERGEGGWEGM